MNDFDLHRTLNILHLIRNYVRGRDACPFTSVMRPQVFRRGCVFCRLILGELASCRQHWDRNSGCNILPMILMNADGVLMVNIRILRPFDKPMTRL